MISPCHECQKEPTEKFEDDLHYFGCDTHGHLACGPTVEIAIANWNHLVTRLIEMRGKEAA